MNNKKEIRKNILQKRKLITYKLLKLNSDFIINKIIQKFNLGSKKIGIYFPINNEVNLINLFNIKNKKFIPFIKNNIMFFSEINSFNKKELIKNKKIIEPKIKKNILIPEIIFIPIVAFNENCFRIGYGGGFYDKYLKNKSILKIGIAFDFQKIHFIPEIHDIQLNYIITEKNIYRKKCKHIFPIL